MSSRVALTPVSNGQYPEEGAPTKSLVAMDTSDGNKIAHRSGQVCVFLNNDASPQTLTYTYDDERGEERTKEVTLAAGECIVAEFDVGLCRHSGDAAENGGFVWVTASDAGVLARPIGLKNR